MSNKRSQKVVVLGGGITGLSTAYSLMKKSKEQGLDLEIELLEASDRFGGKIRTFQEQGFTMEAGPDSFLARKTAAVDLIREVGLEADIVGTNPKAKKTYIMHNRKLHLIPGGMVLGIPSEIKPFIGTGLLSWRGKLRSGMELFVPKAAHEDDESLGHFLRRRLGDEIVDQIVEPLLSGIYAGDADTLSLRATFPQFKEMEKKHGSLIRGILAQKRAAAASAAASVKPAAPGPASGSIAAAAPRSLPASVFYSLRRGLGSLVDAVVDELRKGGVVLRTDAAVAALEAEASGAGPALSLIHI